LSEGSTRERNIGNPHIGHRRSPSGGLVGSKLWGCGIAPAFQPSPDNQMSVVRIVKRVESLSHAAPDFRSAQMRRDKMLRCED
jgi:hypothetical protein